MCDLVSRLDIHEKAQTWLHFVASGCIFLLKGRMTTAKKRPFVPPIAPDSTAHVCQQCGVVICAYNKRRKFCSRKCVGISLRTRVFRCAVCEKEFDPDNRQGRKRTCSVDCYNVLRIINYERTRVKKVVPQSVCPICGTIFNTFKHYSRRSTCSHSCRVAYSWRMKNRKKRTDIQVKDPVTHRYIKKATPSPK